MASVSSSDVSEVGLIPTEDISLITVQSEVVFFSYSPAQRTLLSHSANVEQILGEKPSRLALDAGILLRYIHPDDRFSMLEQVERALRGETALCRTYRWIRPDTNEQRRLHCRAALAHTPDRPRAAHFDGIILDLTVALNEPLGESSARQPAALNLARAPFTFFLLDEDLRVTQCNDASPKTLCSRDGCYDFSALTPGRAWLEFFKDETRRGDMQAVLRDVLQEKIAQWSCRLSELNPPLVCTLFPVGAPGAGAGVGGVLASIEREVRLEQQLEELRKGEALRQLAARAAHNFNNALQTIFGHASAINSHPDQRMLVTYASSAIIENVNRAANLTRQLLVLDESRDTAATAVDLNLVTMSALNRVPLMFSSAFKVSVIFGNPPPAAAREEDLISALSQFCEAAQSTLGEGDELAVRTSQVTLDHAQVAALKNGAYVKLRLGLSGPPARAMQRTRLIHALTRPDDEATKSPLGLLPRVARDLGGTVVQETDSADECSAAMYLPACEPEERPAAEPREKEQVQTAPDILIVDDDAMVLETVSAVLHDAGYACVVADDMPHALSLARAHHASLRLVLVDAVMPGADSPALIRKLLRLGGALKVVGFSGAGPEHTQPLLEAGAQQIIHKPVEPRELKNTIREILRTA